MRPLRLTPPHPTHPRARPQPTRLVSRASPAPPPPPPPFALFVIGSLNADLVLTVPRLPAPGETLAASSMSTFPGGKGGNQAVAAAKLGWPTLMVGQVGGVGGPASLTSPPPTPDGGARLLLASLAASAVDTRYVDVLPGTAPTGTAVIMVQEDGTGENSIVIVGGANAEEGAWLDGPGMRGALGDLGRAGPGGGGGPPVGALLLQREIPATVNVAAAGAARAAGVPVILDAGGEDAPLPPALLACVDVVSPNETELARLTGVDLCGRGGGGEAGAVIAAAVALLDASPGLAAVLVKRGAAGSVLVEAGDPVGSPPTITSQAAAPVPAVVDTTGAGDCFTAAYVVGLLRGLAPSARLRYASAAAGLCVQARGAGPSMPGHEAVMEALKGWAEEGVGAETREGEVSRRCERGASPPECREEERPSFQKLICMHAHTLARSPPAPRPPPPRPRHALHLAGDLSRHSLTQPARAQPRPTPPMATPSGGATGATGAAVVSLPSSPPPKAAGVHPSQPPPSLPPNPTPHAVLAHYWGFSAFRSCQEAVINNVLAGADSLVVMATGAGKSLCYQIPALARPGQAAIVVSPLISLMQDQVSALQARGVAACFLGSAQRDDAVTAGAWAGEYALVYITPEQARLAVGRLQALASAGRLSLVAIDEAHCVSEWGECFGGGTEKRESALNLPTHLVSSRLITPLHPAAPSHLVSSRRPIPPRRLISSQHAAPSRRALYHRAHLPHAHLTIIHTHETCRPRLPPGLPGPGRPAHRPPLRPFPGPHRDRPRPRARRHRVQPPPGHPDHLGHAL